MSITAISFDLGEVRVEMSGGGTIPALIIIDYHDEL